MEKRLGVIAGSGPSPVFVLSQAQKQGYFCVTAALRGEADPALEPGEGTLSWFSVSAVMDIVRFFKNQGVEDALFAGKFAPEQIYQASTVKGALLRLLESGRDRSPETIIRLAMDFFEQRGIRFISPVPFLAPAFCAEGVLSRKNPQAALLADMEWGWDKARSLADADIGQCLVVKNKAVVAVEGMEGTDEAVRRGGELAGKGIVVIKTARTHQDPRVDLPAVGLTTIQVLSEVGGAALCFEAGRMPFFQREAALELADKHRIVVFARS